MLPNQIFTGQPKEFWAHVRSISQKGGYVIKGRKSEDMGNIRVFTVDEICSVLQSLGLATDQIKQDGAPTALGKLLHQYFVYRAEVLNSVVRSNLMDVARAKTEYDKLKAKYSPTCPVPMNKQKGEKKGPNFLSAIVNTLVQAHSEGLPVNYNPMVLTTVTTNDVPVRTLSRRVDGCFPSAVNPVGVWEIKEYYFTTTFGSRVADGVYETMLDGMELKELRENTKHDVEHLLIVDAYYTWWVKGRSYLCRMIDMLHMGYVTEVLFGYEAIGRLPVIMKEWVALFQQRQAAGSPETLGAPNL